MSGWQVEAQILLIDEVLAVGDAALQQKCFDVFYRMRDEGKTLLIVTHDMAAVQRFCNRALPLERGRVVGSAIRRRSPTAKRPDRPLNKPTTTPTAPASAGTVMPE